MNFLAHLHLAGDDEEIVLGQMLGDFLEPGWREKYSPRVQAGVRLHQFVDRYTDAHPAVAALRGRVRRPYRRFAGVLLDVFFDHLLARDWERWRPDQPLAGFAQSRYEILTRHQARLSPRLRAALPSMVGRDWLGSYARREGVERALRGMSGRLSRENPLASAGELLDEMGPEISETFAVFFPDLEAANKVELSRVERSRGGRTR